MNSESLFMVANILFLFASYPNIKAALKDRKTLQGFSFSGAFLTFLGMTVTIIATYNMLESISIVFLSFPTWIYWGIVTYYNR